MSISSLPNNLKPEQYQLIANNSCELLHIENELAKLKKTYTQTHEFYQSNKTSKFEIHQGNCNFLMGEIQKFQVAIYDMDSRIEDPSKDPSYQDTLKPIISRQEAVYEKLKKFSSKVEDLLKELKEKQTAPPSLTTTHTTTNLNTPDPKAKEKEIYSTSITSSSSSSSSSEGSNHLSQISYPARATNQSKSSNDKVDFTTLDGLKYVIEAFKKLDQKQAIALFQKLPDQTQKEIFGTHWHVCGGPTYDHPNPDLRAIAHDDFGKASFLGLEKRCDVPVAKKLETLNAYYHQRVAHLDSLITTSIERFKQIDEDRSIRGQGKCAQKKEILLNLAKAIVPQFNSKAIVTAPQAGGQGVEAACAAYIKAYPCLKDFFMKLVPTTRLPRELQTESKETTRTHTQQDERNVEVMKETLQALTESYYISSDADTIQLRGKKKMVDSVQLYTNAGPRPEGARAGEHRTQFYIVNADCLELAEALGKATNTTPLVMNMGNAHHPGGGYEKGARAQEEDLFRRTSLSLALDTKLGKQKTNFYPLYEHGQGEHAGIYTNHVRVFRSTAKEDYEFLDEPFTVAIGTVAAYDKPRLSEYEGKWYVADKGNDTYEKIRTFFHIAEQAGHEYVIPCALGCGAFDNPAQHISQMMMDCLVNEFPNSFKGVYFSVIDDHNAVGKTHNPQGNFIPFKDAVESQGGKLLKLDEII